MEEIALRTSQRCQLVDITAEVQAAVRRSGVQEGICVVYTPHTTAAVTINEHADPDVAHDLLLFLERAIPQVQAGFRHAGGNSDAHIKAALVGPSVTAIVQGGRLQLGTWQGIFFCEFDGPRHRRCWVQVLAAAVGSR